MERRDYLLSVGGAGVGATGSIISYELFSDPSYTEPPDSLQDVSEVDVFLIAGQSNAVGQGNSGGSPTPLPNTAAQYFPRSQNGFKTLSDPVGFPPYQAGSGSAWPAFADAYWLETNSPSVYVQAAIGGTGIHTDSADMATWGGSNRLLHRALRYLNDALETLENAGISTNYRGVLWHQGEKDASGIDAGIVSLSGFRNEFTDMIDVYRSEINDNQARFWIFQLGRPRSGDTSGYKNVRRIQEEVAASDQYTTIIFDKCVKFPEEGKMNDNLHYNQQGLNEMGRTGAVNIASELNIN